MVVEKQFGKGKIMKSSAQERKHGL